MWACQFGAACQDPAPPKRKEQRLSDLFRLLPVAIEDHAGVVEHSVNEVAIGGKTGIV
jgi:hypothetical protein